MGTAVYWGKQTNNIACLYIISFRYSVLKVFKNRLGFRLGKTEPNTTCHDSHRANQQIHSGQQKETASRNAY
jgi:hypothetical protein